MAAPFHILSIDTSGPYVAAGVGHVACVEEMARGQAERLGGMCEEVLAERGLGWSDLGAVAVCVGPGNFTGIRIAVSFARGLALGLGIPSVGVTAFELFHQGYIPSSGRVLVSLPAPQGRAYVQPFLHAKPIAPPMIITPGEVLPDMEQPGLVVWGHMATEIAAAMHSAVVDMPKMSAEPAPLPLQIKHIAETKLRSGKALERAKPLYVKPPDAAPSREQPPVILP